MLDLYSGSASLSPKSGPWNYIPAVLSHVLMPVHANDGRLSDAGRSYMHLTMK
jgi:hypothetical protein